MTSKSIIYLGHDLGYWDDLKKRFAKTYPDAGLSLLDFKLSEKSNNKIIHDLYMLKPQIIYVDVDEKDPKGSELGMLLKRINFFSRIPVVALVSDLKQVKKLISVHFDFVFVKGVETHDVVHHPYKLIRPEDAVSGEFALAKLSDDIKLKEIARVGYYGLSAMHVEANNLLAENTVVEIEHALDKNQMATNYFVTQKIGDNNVYYGARHWIDFEYLFVDPAKKEDGSFSLNVEDLNEDTLNKKVMIGRTFKKWVNENSSYGSRKRTKLLMIDPDMHYFQESDKMIDSYDFVFRVNEKFNNEYKYIERIRPDIIVYCFPDPNVHAQEDQVELEESSKETKTQDLKNELDVDTLKQEAKKIESIEEAQDAILKDAIVHLKNLGPEAPYLIILNCKSYTSISFQQKFNYPHALVNPSRIGMNVLAQMIHQLEEKRLEKETLDINSKIAALRKKDPMKYAKVNRTYFDPPKYFVSKKSDLSHALILRDAKLKEISESICFFTIDEEISFGNYYLTHPFNFAVKVVPHEGKDNVKEGDSYKYLGLIHAIGEKEKMRLRQFVNDIYTQHKKEQREQEEQALKEANEKFLLDKKKAQAEAQTEAQEDASQEETSTEGNGEVKVVEESSNDLDTAMKELDKE